MNEAWTLDMVVYKEECKLYIPLAVTPCGAHITFNLGEANAALRYWQKELPHDELVLNHWVKAEL